MQDSAQDVANKMMTQLPPEVQAEHDIYQGTVYECRLRGVSEHSLGGVLSFAKELNDNPVYVTSLLSAGAQHIVGSPISGTGNPATSKSQRNSRYRLDEHTRN